MRTEAVQIYTDGSCKANRGSDPGGYGAVILYLNGDTVEIWGSELSTTNNRMELTAVLEACALLEDGTEARIFSDSRYFTDAYNQGWIARWRNRDFKNVKNEDLWRRIEFQMKRLHLTLEWVPAHAGVVHNERADTLAKKGTRDAINGQRLRSYYGTENLERPV